MTIQKNTKPHGLRVAALTGFALVAGITFAGATLGSPLVTRGLAFIGFVAEATGGQPTTPAVPPSPDKVVPIFYSALGPDNDELHLQAGTHRLMIRTSMGDPTRELAFSLVRLETRQAVASPLVRNRRAEFFEVTFEPGDYELVESSFPDQPVHITISPSE